MYGSIRVFSFGFPSHCAAVMRTWSLYNNTWSPLFRYGSFLKRKDSSFVFSSLLLLELWQQLVRCTSKVSKRYAVNIYDCTHTTYEIILHLNCHAILFSVSRAAHSAHSLVIWWKLMMNQMSFGGVVVVAAVVVAIIIVILFRIDFELNNNS